MFAKRRQYSLNRRITLFCLIPLIFLLAILFLYLNVYRANVEKMAEATFRGLADLKHQQVEDNLNELRSITKEIAYSSLLQQYLVETNESEKVQTYGHFQNYLRAITTNSEAIISAYASLGKHSREHMADGYLFTFEETQKRLNLEEKLDKNAEYFTELKSLPGASVGQLYGMYFYGGSPIHAGSIYKNSRMVGGIIYDPAKLLTVDEESQAHVAVLVMENQPVYLSGSLEAEQLNTLLPSQEQRITLKGIDYYCEQRMLLDRQEMKFVYLVPRESLIENTGFWEKQTLVFVVLAAVVLSLSVLLILQSIFRPIKHLCHEVDALRNYGEELSTPPAKELAVLTDTYNATSGILNQINKTQQTL